MPSLSKVTKSSTHILGAQSYDIIPLRCAAIICLRFAGRFPTLCCVLPLFMSAKLAIAFRVLLWSLKWWRCDSVVWLLWRVFLLFCLYCNALYVLQLLMTGATWNARYCTAPNQNTSRLLVNSFHAV